MPGLASMRVFLVTVFFSVRDSAFGWGQSKYTPFSLLSRIYSKGKNRHTLSGFRKINTQLGNQSQQKSNSYMFSTTVAENKKLSVMSLVAFYFYFVIHSYCLLLFYRKANKNWIFLYSLEQESIRYKSQLYYLQIMKCRKRQYILV